jgi:primosomal protein N' (replication factor Y)
MVAGVVLEISQRASKIPPQKLKPIEAVIDHLPVIEEELLDFLLHLSRYYIAPVGEVVRLALPAVERGAVEVLGRARLEHAELHSIGRLLQFAVLTGAKPEAPLSGQAQALFQELERSGPRSLSELEKQWKSARAVVRRLEQAGLVTLERRELERDRFFSEAVPLEMPPELTEPQRLAVDRITECLESRRPAQFLLDGVTASGKTEVYLRAVQHCLKLEMGAIVLVPEIALTPQLVARFRARLGDAIAVLHSGLAEAERHSRWKALRSGAVRIAVGARSALFAPVRSLGLVCVDEEHDGSFKQEEGVRYHARDMALLRAFRAGAVCVLGSATPSLASEALVRSGKLERLRLPARARRASVLPEVEIVNLCRVGASPAHDSLLSMPLYRELERVLQAKEQAILFLNRRGFAPSVLCGGCGYLWRCPNCSIALTLHGSELLRCHYCDHAQRRASRCARCGSDRILEEGAGTERLEKLIARVFPSARVARLDRDAAPGAKSELVLRRMRDGEIDILVGTQMVTKGHDLPSVTLVAIVNADAALSLPDFQANERSFHLLVQVAGRAGRADRPGKVLIQTRIPDHPAIQMAARHDVVSFVERELGERRSLRYPPFSRIALVRVESEDEARARAEAGRLAGLAKQVRAPGVEILGPAMAPLARLRNRWRFRFMVRATDRSQLRRTLLAVARAGADRRVRLAIDVDPVNML